MSIFDDHKNFALSTVSVAPSPTNSGVNLTLSAGTVSLFPVPPFNAVIWPTIVSPNATNAEIVRVTALSGGGIVTMIRGQEDTLPRFITVGDQFGANITARTLKDVEIVVEGNTPMMFSQLAPSTVWTIIHNRNRFPFVHTIDSAGETVFGDVHYIDSNGVFVMFSAAISGVAYLVG